MVTIPRRVDGFNQPFYEGFSTVLDRDQTGTLTAPAGPGRIEAVSFIPNDVDVDTAVLNLITVIVDGTTLLSDNGTFFWHTYNVSLNPGVFASRATGAAWSNFQRIINLDYESSASISITNDNSPDPCHFVASAWGRCGR